MWAMSERPRHHHLLNKLPNEIIIMIGRYMTSKDRVSTSLQLPFFTSIKRPNKRKFS
jgi:hypothetical protein